MVQKEALRRVWEDYQEQVLAEAERLRGREMPVLTEELFGLFEKNGNRLVYEAVYFERRRFFAVLGLASIIGGRVEDISMLNRVIGEICGELSWALPAHVSPEDNRPGRRDLVVDLFASETAHTLSELITVLSGRLDTEICALAKKEIFRRVLDPFFSSSVGHFQWELQTHNWAAVCGGSIGCACMNLLQDQPEVLDGHLERLKAVMERYLSGFRADGACMEGLGYFTYGMTYFTGFAQQLLEYTDGACDLFADDKVARIAAFQRKCYFDGGRTLAFSDGDSRERYRLGLSCLLALRYPEAALPPLERAASYNTDTCYRWMGIYRDYIWTGRYLKEAETAGQEAQGDGAHCYVLPEAQWCICQSRNGAGMAIKGGCNDEPHNHNDVGSFFYLSGPDMLLTDLGAGEYTKAYFGTERYSIFCNSSLSHNVLQINGTDQLAGAEYACSSFAADGQGRTTLFFAGAYEKGLIGEIRRETAFDLENGRLCVTDRFVCTARTECVTEKLVTEFVPEVEEGRIVIRGSQRKVLIHIEGKAQVRVEERLHKDHQGRDRKVYLLLWDVALTDGRGEARFSVETD